MGNYLALQSFFKKFPEYASNEFYVTGESYGGIYVPTLSLRILQGNATINMKVRRGVYISNPPFFLVSLFEPFRVMLPLT